MGTPREQDLYPPIKALLEGQGYTVKAEVGAADVVAVRGDEPPVVVELKTSLSLALVHQGIARQALTDAVYLAVPAFRGPRARAARKANLALCRRLGLGLILVRPQDGHVEVAVDPGPYQPRKSKPRLQALLREFARLEGDPNTGGMARRGGIVTAYRQDALRLVAHLAEHGPSRGRDVAAATGVVQATRMMRDNHHGWFEKVEQGVYRLSPAGEAAAGD